ncbi:hypothetical protein AN960_16630 [Bacillus sp. FJAT-25509]|uniref:hypothetical protein n=1 Tax=Bacillus sp. FJAT-25509 TaxID=1712029 RepID=UPI0006F9A04A|nr:hypothetical protein [Bacillus sp. FJAT-25509]KQL36247.1 hypothetical protein AN960_16630 [Bacillus sp. FJAT-25509]
MRLREIKQILEENVNFLRAEYKEINGKYEILAFQEIYKAIRNLENLGFLKEDIEYLESMDTIFHDKSQRVIVDGTGLTTFATKIDIINLKVVAVINAIKEALPEQDQNSISIKLPMYTELKEVSIFMKEIDMILNQTFINEYKSSIKLQNFDSGSNWIEIILENKEAIIFMGGLVNSAINFLKSSYLSWKQTSHTIKMLETEDNARQLILKALEENIKMQAQSHASALMKDFNIDESHQEYHTNLSHSIQKLAELLSKGTEVHTALNAPEETKQAFPDVEKTLTLIENATKLLTNGNSEE